MAPRIPTVRGAEAAAATENTSYPGTYRSGCYDRSLNKIGDYKVTLETLVNLPNPLPLTVRLVGEVRWLHMLGRLKSRFFCFLL